MSGIKHNNHNRRWREGKEGQLQFLYAFHMLSSMFRAGIELNLSYKYYYPHFTNEETEYIKQLASGHIPGKWVKQNLNPVCLVPNI